MNRSRRWVIGSANVEGEPALAKTPSKQRLRASIFRILAQNTLCSIATITSGNRAHINTAYFCYSDDLELYFWSHPRSLHCRNLARNPSMAVAVFSSSQEWAKPDGGLQLFGTCKLASGAYARSAERLYARRFKRYATWKAGRKPGEPASSYRFYRFVPASLKVLDEAEFGDAVFVAVEMK